MDFKDMVMIYNCISLEIQELYISFIFIISIIYNYIIMSKEKYEKIWDDGCFCETG